MVPEYISSLRVKELDADLQKLASTFNCGNFYIDGFLQSKQALDPGIGKTYVWLNDEETEIIGFYSITTGGVDQIDEDGTFKMGGAVHINEFALDTEYHKTPVSDNTYMSDLLLQDCIDRVVFLREHHIGFSFITLQSTDEGHYLYVRNDFEDIEEDMNLSKLKDKEVDCKPMYLPLDVEM